MTILQSCVRGDRGDSRIVQLDGVEDLTGVTAIEAHVWKATDRAGTTTTLTASVLDETDRTITIDLGTDLVTGWLPAVATRGEWSIEYELTFGAMVLTWPNGGADKINVREQGD